MFKTVKDINLSGKRVLLRTDYNVPLVDGKIADDYRIRQSLPTIEYILKNGPASLIIIAHLGRPKGKPDKALSLSPVAKRLAQLLGRPVGFAPQCTGDAVKELVAKLSSDGILLLENLRFRAGEETNDPDFAKAIVAATSAEIFVQDGFGVVHRAHASTQAITKILPSVGGLLLEKEVETIVGVMNKPARPLVAVVGGAKISDKIDVLNKFIELADCVAVTGALANNFLAGQGVRIGKSLIDPDAGAEASEIWHRAQAEEQKRPFNFLVPVDVVVSKSLDGRSPTRIVDIASHSLADIEAYPKLPKPDSYSVRADELILDIGPISAAEIVGAIKIARTVVWAGTCGVTETKGIAGGADPFAHGSKTVAEAMIGQSNSHKNKPFSVVGGGDSVRYISSEGWLDDFNHVSTGGSASLDLMAGKKLPGIEALLDK
ncbi:phosphoglycerate kinase [Candidatus Saccharibacteria bacterium]|nr:phosphoglycerate kinase [Candidatus Saccharibacteria bacterium]